MVKNLSNIRGYLTVIPPLLIKKFLWGFLGLLNIFNAFMFKFIYDLDLKQALNLYVNAIFFVITLVFDLWAIYILLDTKTKQNQFILFSGLVSFFLSAMYIYAFYEIIYMILDIKSLVYIYIIIFLYIFILALNLLILHQLLNKGNFKRKKQKGIFISLILICFNFGIMGEKLYNKFSDARSQLIVTAFIILLFGYCFLFTTHNTYKYYLIKKYSKPSE